MKHTQKDKVLGPAGGGRSLLCGMEGSGVGKAHQWDRDAGILWGQSNPGTLTPGCRQPDTDFSAVLIRVHEAGLLKGKKYFLNVRENKAGATSSSRFSLGDFSL